MHFAFTFSEYSWLILPKRLWKWASTISFSKYKWKVVLLLIYLLNYDSSQVNFLHVECGIWYSVFWRSEYSFCYINLGIRKTPTRKIPTHQTPPWKIPTRKIPTQKIPTWNIPTRVFKFFVFPLLSPSSLILLKRLFCNSIF